MEPVGLVVVIGDGMADWVDERGRTPLSEAEHPNMDEVASRGVIGAVEAIPDGMDAGSDVAIMSLMGYDPKKYYTGRGPLEAAAMKVELGKGDLAFRCNLVTVENGVLVDYSAGHISNEEAAELISYLAPTLTSLGRVELYVGVSYRHVLVLRGGFSDQVKCSPPHESVGRRVEEVMVEPLADEGRATAELLNKLMLTSYQLLKNHPVNVKRLARGLRPANMIWPWGHGKKPLMPSFRELYGLRGSVISAVNLVKGLGVYLGLRVIEVPGATGYFDTNYEGKADYAVRALESGDDLVFVHVEAPDEAGHMGSFELKLKAIEDLDKRLIGRLLSKLRDDDAIAILCDHATPVATRVHVRGPTPYAYSKLSCTVKKARKYTEGLVISSRVVKGHELLKEMLVKLKLSK
ncbi:MAG: cofactor-independent phosphoglycerate mutase [Candidatus Nezhaarchaeota archaeon]|nr:cofactor-independent phosphoglycerate mutase [Candidatus Nezhaarchaeota archaeon]